ncbi:uncharacterized protein LOC126162074 isoform X2 [Schistocerca cancellata]|uniref:uncharacterized protein LOC126162074 isoform X2 n=1 Tax=Schistocerca cancellata TaxID=274614 RepID=UPI002117BA63|nr:uncharacterized protein LOC126162074 isoform X2 [Schistocerca cancellata]
MRLDLFTVDDTVLLVGEGNFSFCVDLVSTKKFVNITASCLDTEVKTKKAEENVLYLKQKGVRVLFGVDATKLTEHPVLKNESFSKIVFNFPHVGGKMKINLNRELLRQFALSACHLLDTNGQLLISLCKGQGGTSAEKQIRRWDDTWKVVEMVADGNLVLTAVEPFDGDSYPNYKSAGYRGTDKSFHTDGALVHIFCKRQPLFPSVEVSVLQESLEQCSIKIPSGEILCPKYYFQKYIQTPVNNVALFFQNSLKTFIEHSEKSVRSVQESEVPLFDPRCFSDSSADKVLICPLRHSLLDITSVPLHLWWMCHENYLLYSGMVFHDLGSDFSQAPVSNQIMLFGYNSYDILRAYLDNLLLNNIGDHFYLKASSIVNSSPVLQYKSMDCPTFIENTNFEVKLANILLLSKDCEIMRDSTNTVLQHFTVDGSIKNEEIHTEFCLMYPDTLSEILFHTSWRHLYASETCLKVGYKNIHVKFSSLYGLKYSFDICFSQSPLYSHKKFYSILWQLVGDIVTDVQLLNTYESPKGWTSHCFRIEYQSFDKALSRKKAIDIHQNVVGKMLSHCLQVTIH